MWKWQTRISSQLPTAHWFSCSTCGVNPMGWRRRQRRKSQHSLWSSTSSIPWISSCSRLDRTGGRCSNVSDQKEHRRTGLTQCAFLPHMFFADFKSQKITDNWFPCHIWGTANPSVRRRPLLFFWHWLAAFGLVLNFQTEYWFKAGVMWWYMIHVCSCKLL